MSYQDFKSKLKPLCQEQGLRPVIRVPEQPTKFANQPGSFYLIFFYWDEYYLDKITFTKGQQLNQLKTKVGELAAETITDYVSHDWGGSDGSLFVTINIK